MKGYSTLPKVRAGASSSDGFVSYLGHSLVGESYPSSEIHLVYSTAPADRSCDKRELRIMAMKEYSIFDGLKIRCS